MPLISRRQLEELAHALEGMPVWGCMPGSTGAEAGIRYGDVLLAANGVRTKRVEDYFSAKELRDDGVELLIFRDGVELTLFVAYRPFKGPMADFAHMVADGRYVTPRGPEEPNKAPAS